MFLQIVMAIHSVVVQAFKSGLHWSTLLQSLRAGTTQNGHFPMWALTECPQSTGLCLYLYSPSSDSGGQMPFFFFFFYTFVYAPNTHTHTQSLYLTSLQSYWHWSSSFPLWLLTNVVYCAGTERLTFDNFHLPARTHTNKMTCRTFCSSSRGFWKCIIFWPRKTGNIKAC